MIRASLRLSYHMYAAFNAGLYNSADVIDSLIFAGTDVHAKSITGKKAVDYAREALHYKAAKILEELM